jgi:hypothetical protein
MIETPEPKDKLDAATTTVVVVNGPEDDALGWRQVDWRAAEADVRRLRQRIFTAPPPRANRPRLARAGRRAPAGPGRTRAIAARGSQRVIWLFADPTTSHPGGQEFVDTA